MVHGGETNQTPKVSSGERDSTESVHSERGYRMVGAIVCDGEKVGLTE